MVWGRRGVGTGFAKKVVPCSSGCSGALSLQPATRDTRDTGLARDTCCQSTFASSCTSQHPTALHFAAPQCTTIHHSATHCTTPHHTLPQCTAPHHSAPHCTAPECSAECTRVHCGVPPPPCIGLLQESTSVQEVNHRGQHTIYTSLLPKPSTLDPDKQTKNQMEVNSIIDFFCLNFSVTN